LVVLTVVRAARGYKVRSLSIGILVAAILAVVLTSVSAGLVFIQPEERGVVISALAPDGYRDEPLQPGLNWIIPYFESVVRYPISKQTYTMSIAPSEGQIQGDDSVASRTSDGQEIFMDASVIYAIDPEKVIQYTSTGRIATFKNWCGLFRGASSAMQSPNLEWRKWSAANALSCK
jgi:regulator of protease activity HflC (stomatin/prohibitin superfamily)